MNIVTWITQNYQTVFSIAFGFIMLCSLIVRITPNTKDDEIVSKIINFLDNFSVVKTAKDRDLLERAKGNIIIKKGGAE